MSDENTVIEDAEVVEDDHEAPSSAITRRPESPPDGPITLFGSADPLKVIESATETAEALTEIIERRELYKTIGKRNHVVVEGWTLLGSMLGVFPITVWTRKVSDDSGEWRPPKIRTETKTLHSKWCKKGKKGHAQHAECDTYTKDVAIVEADGVGGWEARVEAHTRTGDVVGAAEAECRWDEWAWRDRDSYALRSMAQTRATSKALRMPLGFIVELAGFSATPAEEIPDHGSGDSNAEPERTFPCPHCGSPVYDNTTDPEKMEKNWPAFKCKNRACDGGKDGEQWATWDRGFFDSAQTKAKKAILKAVESHLAGWRVYYSPDDPAHTPEMKDKIETALAEMEDGSKPAMAAGLLWNEILESREINPEEMDTLTMRIIPRLAENILSRAAEDASDIITIEEAWEAAEEQIITEDQERYEGMSDYK